MAKKPTSDNTITVNRKARHDFMIDKTYEAGLCLEGWEIKSIRSGRCQLKDSYIHIRNGEAWLLQSHISALVSTSSHKEVNPVRSRKLLLTQREIKQLTGAVKQKGFSIIALRLYWKKKRYIKIEIALAKGKKLFDKRMSEKEKTLKKEAWRR